MNHGIYRSTCHEFVISLRCDSNGKRAMRPSQALESNRAAIRDIVARHRVRGVRVFGSVLRGTDTDGSDLDLLVEPTEQTTLLDIGKIQFELSQLLGIDVDVLTPGALPEILREKVLAESQPV